MPPKKTQPTRSKPPFDWKRMLSPAGIILFVVMLLAAVIIGILVAMTSGNFYNGIYALIALVATVLALYPVLVPERLAAKRPSSNTIPFSLNDAPSGCIPQTIDAKAGQPIFFFNLRLSDPSEFYGHTMARTTLITRIANGGSSSIVGERRAGKTWLLDYLQLIAPTHEELGLSYRVGIVSADDIECQDLAGFVRWALAELGVLQSSYDLNSQPLEQLSQGVHALRKEGIIPVLCIDEFDGFNSNRQEFNVGFFRRLRALAERKKDRLILVTASRRSLKELIGDLIGQTSPFFNMVDIILLQSFTQQEAREFVSKKSNIVDFTEKERDFFLDQSMYRSADGELYWPPLLLQCVGQLLLNDKQDIRGQPLDDQLDKFDYRRKFQRRLSETYQTVV